MGNINKDRLFETFRSLATIDSLSFKEKEFKEALVLKLKDLGIAVSEDDAAARIGGNAGNLFARIDATDDRKEDPSVLFSAHMDTVSPGEGKQIILNEDGKITSDGSTVLGADDVAGIAEILEAVSEILESGQSHPAIELFFPVAEEAYTVGSSAFDTGVVSAKRAYFLDRRGAVGSVTRSEPTLISFEIDVFGKAAHAGFDPERGVNAILIASRAIANLPIGRVDEDTTLAIGIIEGGKARNIVPDHVSVKGEIRSRSDKGAFDILKQMETSFAENADKAGGRIELRQVKHLSAYRVDEDSAALKAYENVLKDEGIAIVKEDSFGGSDTNSFRAKGIDAICIANAMYDIHTTSEYTTLDEMATVTAIVKKLITG